MNTLKDASTFRVFMRGLFKGASTYKNFHCNIESLLEKFVKVRTQSDAINNLWLGL